ncbi:chromosome segregation protein SMC [Methylobacterium indicum]|uniref:DNA sulfur modification protein DndD n=1 Tax=Methylobacterium indicum TaxID=1775910 RepID=UPI0007347142|nr:DNA sulfur modification protein DndD [Methylobacterium indicum]KTS25902.1 chromosome segregation protein SMC [Methylobacterium indicum]KTS30711.1 chromosome segregation protein SMC [Methylobacterium indicum]KTS52505.1 chromosome segregation protein SMC [Methylobacterium indicum]
MMLRTVRLHDFGLYGGENAFDLAPRRGPGGKAAPIVLVGGRNGAGKTTLLEAVRLALYGRRALGPRVAQSDYEDYLRRRIHAGRGATSARVELEFDYAEAGVVHRYHVGRGWSVRGKALSEHLQVEKDGAPISSVPREEWHQFLQELVPPGVSQLFFFDGEKIQDIADDAEHDDGQLAEAVRGLLGIELVGRLREDLGLLVARHGRAASRDAVPRLQACDREIAEVGTRVSALSEEVAELASARDSQVRAAEHVRLRFVAEGGDEAARRGQVEAARDQARREVTRCENELRAMANKLLPFAVAPRLAAAFRDALARSGAGGERGTAARSLAAAMLAWRASGDPPRRARWEAAHWQDVARFLQDWTDGGEAPDSTALREVGDGRVALERLEEAESVTRPHALSLAADLEGALSRLAAAERALARADNAAAGLLLEELSAAEQKVGATEAMLRARRSELDLARGRLASLTRERRNILSADIEGRKSADRAELAARTARALAVYEERLLLQKLARLEREFTACFNRLARKKSLVAAVRIDRTTFATTLVDAVGRELPKTQLSAGEKQIYAVAMLWALARTSGRPLPMIIDTPLGRLDSEHRRNLVRHYFPEASHQVVLLSTDTEVDGDLARELAGGVSHAYTLEFDGGRTQVVPGFFEDAAKEGNDLALQQA